MNEFEVECIPGLEEFVEGELRARLFRTARVIGRPREGRMTVQFPGDPARLNALRTASAVYQVLRFDVPRPRALLGHEHLTRILDLLRGVVAVSPPGAYSTFHLSAAGAESTVFSRLASDIAANLGMLASTGPANLLVAVYPSRGTSGWEVSARLSPLPLSARAWRVCNLPGALNATIANAMVRLADPKPTDRFLNLCCGSGTLMVERLELMPAKLCAGIDSSVDAIACAARNVQASGHTASVQLITGDATRLQFDDGSIDAIVADLPYGHLVGAEANIDALYSGLLAEATRVIAPSGHLVVITTRKRLFEQALAPFESAWQPVRALSLRVPFRSGYIQPSVYALTAVF